MFKLNKGKLNFHEFVIPRVVLLRSLRRKLVHYEDTYLCYQNSQEIAPIYYAYIYVQKSTRWWYFFKLKVQICEWLVMCFCLKYNQGGKSPIMNETTNYIKSLQKSWMVSNDSNVCLKYPSKYSNLYVMTNGFLYFRKGSIILFVGWFIKNQRHF